MAPRRKANPGTERIRVSPNLISSSYLGRTSITAKELKDLAKLHWLSPDRVEVPRKEETSPRTRDGYIAVFLRFFDGGLRLPCVPFVGEVLDYYKVEIQQLTVNALMRLAIFEWAFRMEGVVPDAAAFVATHKAWARKQDCALGKEYVSMYETISVDPRVETEVPTKAYREHWGPNFLSKWFYYRVGPKSNLRLPTTRFFTSRRRK